MSHLPPDRDDDKDPGDEWKSPDLQFVEADSPAKSTGRPSLLFMLAVLGVFLALGAVVVPNFMRARARGQLTSCKSNLKNIGTALEMYATDFNGKYPPSMALLVPKYLNPIPECPAASEGSYEAVFGPRAPYNTEASQDYYLVRCVGGRHASSSVEGNFPAYNAIQGSIERAP